MLATPRMTALQTLAFGDLGSGLWGAVLAGLAEPPLVCLGAAGAVVAVNGRLEGADSAEGWQLTGQGFELAVVPAGEPVSTDDQQSGMGGFDQLCRVTGRIELDGAAHEISSLGCRTVRDGDFDISRYQSLREVSAWFEPGDGLTLTALRPLKAKGQETDVVRAAVLDADSLAAVEDPRLSTTYTAAGWPARAGLELWLADQAEEHPLVRRAAGEPAGERLESPWGELDVRVELFRWHSRGSEGAGVYLLATRR